jgi:hypothetical protein
MRLLGRAPRRVLKCGHTTVGLDSTSPSNWLSLQNSWLNCTVVKVLSVPYSHSHEKRRDCVVFPFVFPLSAFLIPSTNTVLEFESYFQSSFKNIGQKFRDVGVSEFSLVSGGRVLGNRSWSQLFMLGRSHLGRTLASCQ